MNKLYQLLLLFSAVGTLAQGNYNLIVGTYTNTCESEGIYVYDYNTASGELELKGNTNGIVNPSFLTVSAGKEYIYSVNENGDDSKISSFSYTPGAGSVKLINQVPANGTDPCYIISDDKNIITANYSSGSITVFGRNEDGSVGTLKQTIKHKGSGKTARQESPHVHMVRFSPDKKYIIAADLGTDKLYTYKYNPAADSAVLVLQKEKKVKEKSGPRHFVFNPNNSFVYLLHELDATLSAHYYGNDTLTTIQRATVAPATTGVKNGAADIHITKDGKFIYATNRGDANTISVFRVHANGKINMVQQLSTMGIAPRNFAIGPNENFVVVANQQSNNIVVFKRDKTTGMLEDTGNSIEVCQPVCLVFTENQ